MCLIFQGYCPPRNGKGVSGGYPALRQDAQQFPLNFDTSGYGSTHYLPAPRGSGGFLPMTPYIPGAVLNGIGGDKDDMPDLRPGSWMTCEYWTPMVGLTLWLMAELTEMN